MYKLTRTFLLIKKKSCCYIKYTVKGYIFLIAEILFLTWFVLERDQTTSNQEVRKAFGQS